MQRPISPHITIYKKQISSTLSIMHRITGMGLFFSLLILSWCFIGWIFSRYNECYINFINHYLIKLCLFVITFSCIYHLCNGIRHLVWDTGKWFTIKEINISGWSVVIISSIVTLLIWII